MPDKTQLKILEEGPEAWNQWREGHPEIKVDLRNSNLKSFNLYKANLTNADLYSALLWRADLREADLSGATLSSTNLNGADLSGANLNGANLRYASLVGADLTGVSISNSYVYGASIWNLKGKPKEQFNIIITPPSAAAITVDDIEVAQFIFLLLNRSNLRNVLNTITSKAVLVLGRFTYERKEILNCLANELRKNNLLPIIFDFDRPVALNFTETIRVLAGISLFIIADITKPRAVPLELQAIVPDFQKPLIPIIQEGEEPFDMFVDLARQYNWVLNPVIIYSSSEQLSDNFKSVFLDRAWKKHQELQTAKAQNIETLSIDEFITQKH